MIGRQRAAAPVGRLPSTDLYFRDPCGDWLGGRWRRGSPIRAHGANCFVRGEAMLLIRRDSEAAMRAALDWPGRLAYLIDDDIAGAADSPELPGDYRARLADLDRDFHQSLLARADRLVAASDVLGARLAAHYPNTSVARIEPFWREPVTNQRHFAGLDSTRPLMIAHLGSASHRAGLAAIAPALAGVMRRHASVRFTYVAPAPALGALDGDARVRRVAPLPWPRYRRWLVRQRFHLALYPLTASRFDRARSANKLREHAICGAVGIYPDDWLPARALKDGALFAPADPAQWEDALEQAIARRADLAALAGAAARSLSCHDDRAGQRDLWSDLFGIAHP